MMRLQVGKRSYLNPSVLASIKTLARPQWRVSHETVLQHLDSALVAARGPEYMERRWLRQLFSRAGMRYRHMFWHPSLLERLGSSGFPDPRQQATTMNRSVVESGALLKEVSEKVLAEAGVRQEEVARLVSSTEVGSPTGIEEQSHFSEAFTRTKRIHLRGFGCVSGMITLRDSADFLRGRPEAVAQTGVVEMPSMVGASGLRYMLNEIDARNTEAFRHDVMFMMITGDLAGAGVLFGAEHPKFAEAAFQRSGLVIVDSESYNLAGTQSIVTATYGDHGTRGIITRHVPTTAAPIVNHLIKAILERNGLQLSQIKSLLVHPGGKKVLEMLEEAAGDRNRKADPRFLEASYDTLENYGNCIGATIYQVVTRELEIRPSVPEPEPVVLVGMGMGMTFEAILAYRFPQGYPASAFTKVC